MFSGYQPGVYNPSSGGGGYRPPQYVQGGQGGGGYLSAPNHRVDQSMMQDVMGNMGRDLLAGWRPEQGFSGYNSGNTLGTPNFGASGGLGMGFLLPGALSILSGGAAIPSLVMSAIGQGMGQATGNALDYGISKLPEGMQQGVGLLNPLYNMWQTTQGGGNNLQKGLNLYGQGQKAWDQLQGMFFGQQQPTGENFNVNQMPWLDPSSELGWMLGGKNSSTVEESQAWERQQAQRQKQEERNKIQERNQGVLDQRNEWQRLIDQIFKQYGEGSGGWGLGGGNRGAMTGAGQMGDVNAWLAGGGNNLSNLM